MEGGEKEREGKKKKKGWKEIKIYNEFVGEIQVASRVCYIFFFLFFFSPPPPPRRPGTPLDACFVRHFAFSSRRAETKR